MPQFIDREEFDEVVDAIHLIQATKREYERDLRVLRSSIPDSKIRFRFTDFIKENRAIDRSSAEKYTTKRIDELEKRKEQIIQRLENELTDKSHNLRNYLSGDNRLKMTNPTSKEIFVIIPKNMRVTLYYVLILERKVNANIPICRSDYSEMEKYFKSSKCCYPKELFNI